MTLKLLVDTCVWLDLATDYREQPVIGALEDLIKSGDIELVVPEIVLDEFDRNKQRVIEAAQRSLQSHFRLVREAVNRFADDANKAETLKALNEVDYKIGMKAEAVNDSIDRIRKLLKSTRALSTTAHIKQRVAERALAKKAPYHRERNSVGDAILIEFYAGLATASRARKPRYAFVTHNTKDFSEPNGDRRRPIPTSPACSSRLARPTGYQSLTSSKNWPPTCSRITTPNSTSRNNPKVCWRFWRPSTFFLGKSGITATGTSAPKLNKANIKSSPRRTIPATPIGQIRHSIRFGLRR